MAENSTIQTRRTGSRSVRKQRMNQIPIGIVAIAGILALGLWLNGYNAKMVFYLITGVSFGIILQRARFCFTAAMRDPNLTGSTSLTRAVLIAFAVATIGFTAIKYAASLKGDAGLSIVNASVSPISFATAIGAFMFGIGMVIAGGCASGTLMRVGEGFTMQMLVLIFFIIGSLWGEYHVSFWKENFIDKGTKVFLPDVLNMGYFFAAMLQLVFIALLYVLAEKYEKRKANS